ncbi:MAG: SprB repeat-containing protein, partial [Phaeodactylibacter sp.]|nr:SprB repeat-containing protein [Phaeodactylibacter sp.]
MIAGAQQQVTVTDFCGATATAAYTVPDGYSPLQVLETSIADAICTSSTGSAILSISGGKKPYSISWQGAAASGAATSYGSVSIAGLAAGLYQANIQDACAGAISAPFEVGQSEGAPFTVNGQAAHICEEGGQGSIVTTISSDGNSGPFFYAWNNGADTPGINGLSPGAYTVTVTNRFGCTEEETFEVALFQPDIVAKLTHTCGSDGEISLTFTDGSGINTGSPFQFSWSHGVQWQSNIGFYVNTLAGLLPGEYTVTLTNSWGCQHVQSYEVDAIPGPEISLVDYQASTAVPPDLGTFELENGFLKIAVQGHSSYSVQWSNGATTVLNEGLASGTYTVTVTDNATGCSSVAQFDVPLCPANQVIVSCLPNQVEPATNGNSGSIAIDVSGGIPPYTYSWAGPEEFASTSQDISGLTIPGDYCVTVWDACGQRAKLCREIVDDCGYFDRLDISTLNNCLDGHRSLFRVHGAFINPSYSSNYLYLEWTSDASAFTEQSGLGGLQHDGTGIWYHQLISGPTEIEVPESGRYYCRATDERGCSLTAWADFGIETRFFDIDQHVLSEELIVIDGGFIVSSCGSIFNGKNILSGDLSGGSWSDFYSFCFQSDNPDSPPCQGPGAIIIGNTTYHFLVPPNNQAYQINGFNNECGCIFPLEIFNELPYV